MFTESIAEGAVRGRPTWVGLGGRYLNAPERHG